MSRKTFDEGLKRSTADDDRTKQVRCQNSPGSRDQSQHGS
ncbi:hypothetical protein JOC74_002557 [Bacillus capparidis]|uniref:Uncharacterized protein n=1 Tax=Bacillus capparidis TaxID=1840411 RepID=A0ABS4CXN1_9BACI|nr:hypothetical protein [Bacillus capparidis]